MNSQATVTDANLKVRVDELSRQVLYLTNILNRLEINEFRYDPTTTTYRQRRTKLTRTGQISRSGWDNVPITAGAGTGDITWSSLSLGYSISALEFTANAGYVNVGANAPVAVAADTINMAALSNATYYIYVEYTTGSATAVWVDPPTTAMPQSDATHFRKWFYKVQKTATALTVLAYGHFNIEVWGAYGNA